MFLCIIIDGPVICYAYIHIYIFTFNRFLSQDLLISLQDCWILLFGLSFSSLPIITRQCWVTSVIIYDKVGSVIDSFHLFLYAYYFSFSFVLFLYKFPLQPLIRTLKWYNWNFVPTCMWQTNQQFTFSLWVYTPQDFASTTYLMTACLFIQHLFLIKICYQCFII